MVAAFVPPSISRMALLSAAVSNVLLLSVPGLSAADIAINGHTFTVPDGFEIEVVAQTPLVNRPITADFDEQGRLYVADSSGSNERPDKQLTERTHRIVRLEDTDGDGRFDKSVEFADKMMFPEGTLWYDGSLYVSAPPSIWKLTDTDGDGVADQREEWFDGKTLTGCANDLHGPYLGPDGWIYWCKGAFAEQTYLQAPHQGLAKTIAPSAETDVVPRKLVTKAAHIFRRRADGTGLIENVMTGGMDNPVDVAFMPGGERIFTTTFLQNPGGGLRDGLIHAVYGGVYGKVHNVTDFHPRTGDLLPPLVHMGPAAPCGLTRYESSVFGDDFRDNLFACQFNMHKVSRHQLEPDGATFTSTNSDFVVSSNIDFHPTDVLEDADGSLIVNDTGGWYTLCCPTSQLTKPDILGAIYRVRKAAAPKVLDPRGMKLDWKTASPGDLAARLGDARPAVRARTMQALAKLGAAAIAELAIVVEQSPQRNARLDAVWTLTRIDHRQARDLVRNAMSDRNLTVRLAALSSVSLWRDQQSLRSLETFLGDSSPAIRRAAAEALGRLENDGVVQNLVRAAAQIGKDRVLEHSITYALIEIGKHVQVASGGQRRRPSPHVERVAAIANDQMPGGKVDPQKIVPWLKSNDPALKETALWLVSRHSDWGEALADYLRERLAASELTDAERAELVRQLAQFSSHGVIQSLLAQSVFSNGEPRTVTSRRTALEAMRSSGLRELPELWLEPVTATLMEGQAELVPVAISVVRDILPKGQTAKLKTALLNISLNQNFSPGTRIQALAGIPDGDSKGVAAQIAMLTDNLREEASVEIRSAAVDAVTKSKLDSNSLRTLAAMIPQVGPLELNRLLLAFDHSSDESVGTALIAGLKNSPVLTSLRVDAVKSRMARFPMSVQAEAEELYNAINVEAGRQQQKLDELVASLTEGDIRRGQVVFSSPKAACSACHAMGYVGGNIGPDLSRIGKIRSERDLLESVIFPSVSFVRSYEPIMVTTKAGKQINGLIRRETADEITIATGAKEEARIARADIDEIRPSAVSIMPAGLDTQLTRQQMADLIAFLKSRQ